MGDQVPDIVLEIVDDSLVGVELLYYRIEDVRSAGRWSIDATETKEIELAAMIVIL